MIEISIEYENNFELPVSDETVISHCKKVLKGEGKSQGQVTIVFTEDETLREMKKEFFKTDVYTDVMTFNYEEPDEPLEGEIYISPVRAEDNARTYNEPYRREILRLVIHGTLHLLGYEDDTKDRKAEMRRLEDHYLSSSESQGQSAEK